MTYLLTFNCYGTHLPGDARGWVERARGSDRGSYQDPSPRLLRHAQQLTAGAYQLDFAHSFVVLDAIRETCEFRKWDLLAAHVRTTHVHVVAKFPDPDRAISDLKAYATRALRTRNGELSERKYWARGGSTRALFSVESVNAAIKYVVDRQGEAISVYLKASPR